MQTCILQPLGLENSFTHVLYVTCIQISNHVHDMRPTRDFNVTGQAIDCDTILRSAATVKTDWLF